MVGPHTNCSQTAPNRFCKQESAAWRKEFHIKIKMFTTQNPLVANKQKDTYCFTFQSDWIQVAHKKITQTMHFEPLYLQAGRRSWGGLLQELNKFTQHLIFAKKNVQC